MIDITGLLGLVKGVLTRAHQKANPASRVCQSFLLLGNILQFGGLRRLPSVSAGVGPPRYGPC